MPQRNRILPEAKEMDSAFDKNTIKPLFKKKAVSILITDSGLGGLSVCADVVSRLRRRGIFQQASIIYFNAWPEQNRGYNKFNLVTERIRIFDQALAGMQNYHPDMLMIACNTLSVLYDRTDFSRRVAHPVVDIVRFGVDLIYENLVTIPGSKVLILGTLTTIAEDRHRAMLMEKGIDANRVITQACDGLATAIEKNPEGDSVIRLADRYIQAAAGKIGKPRDKIFVALCCTHFGYSARIIIQQIKRHLTDNVMILNPNKLMGEFLFAHAPNVSHSATAIDVKVVSKIELDDSKLRSISSVIKDISPETAQALVHYEHKPNLFTF